MIPHLHVLSASVDQGTDLPDYYAAEDNVDHGGHNTVLG